MSIQLFDKEASPELLQYLDDERFKDRRSSGHLNNRQMYSKLYGSLPDSLKITDYDKYVGLSKATTQNQNQQTGKKSEYSTDANIFAKVVDSIGDITPNWRPMQQAYNRSITGHLRKYYYGDSKFEEVEDMGMAEDIFATVLSFSMPLDMLTFGIGKWRGAKRTEKMYEKMLAKSQGKSLTIPQQMYAKAVGGGYPLAFYESALEATNAGIEGGDGFDILKGGFKGAARGFTIGSLTSGVSGGFMGRKAKVSAANDGAMKWSQLKKTNFLDGLSWAAASKPGSIAVEAMGFTLGGNLFDMAAGEDVRWDRVFHDWASNAVLVSALKGKEKTWNSVKETTKNTRKFLVERHKKFMDTNPAYKNVMEKMRADKDISPEAGEVLKDQLETLNTEIKESSESGEVLTKDLASFEKKIDKIEKSLDKSNEDYALNERKSFEELHNAEYEMKTLQEDFTRYKESMNPENRVDVRKAEQIESDLKRAQYELEQISEANRKSFNEYIGKVKPKNKEAEIRKEKNNGF